MANSSFPVQPRSLLSYHDDIWHISWGETQTIAALQEEMSRSMRQCTFQQAAVPAASPCSYQLAGFQAVGFVMTSVGGAQCQVPAVVFHPQHDQSPTKAANGGEAKQTGTPQSKVRPRKSARGAAAVADTTVVAVDRSCSRGASSQSCNLDAARPATLLDAEGHPITRETFEGELPSIGSEGHFDGTCKRCAFFPKGRCNNGKDCSHCHFPHEPRSRLRRKPTDTTQAAEEKAITEDSHRADDAYLAEPAAASSECIACECPASAHHGDSEEDEEQPAFDSDADPAAGALDNKDLVSKLNNALQEVAETYAEDSIAELPIAKGPSDIADVDTNASASALSDAGESATMSSVDNVHCPFGSMDESQKGTPTETSDSEISSSSHEGIVASPQSGVSRKQRDVLTPSSSSWAAMRSNRKAGGLEKCTLADISRMTRSLLNKLTEERFESLCSKLLALPISTTEQLAVLVAEIFEKATTQDFFRSLYTELCMRLDAHLAPQTSTIGGKAFRKALVTECQATFERNLQPSDPCLFIGLSGDDCFEVEMKLKTRRLGNMRFIGDLLVRRLLAPKLLPPIIHELLSRDEAALESLIALLTVVAPEFEMKQSLYQAPLRDAFAVLRRKVSDKAVCSRVCCQINDVLDAKARGWAPRSAFA